MKRTLISAILLGLVVTPVVAQDDALPTEADYYPMLALPIPDGVVLEASAIEMMPSGKLAVASRRGDIYLVDKALAETAEEMEFGLFAGGLHEVLGLAYRDGALFATQRGEVTKIVDTDKDDIGDIF